MPARMKPRAATYARYSSERQQDRSITDQLALCRARALADGYEVLRDYSDAAISGAATANRPGFLAMMDDARNGAFTRIYAEDLDRLSRGQGDTAQLFERMRFIGVEIVTLTDGVINAMHAGLKGTMNALYLEAISVRTRARQGERVREGFVAGGLCYGYRPGADRGTRVIQAQEADVVRRIFADFASGLSPWSIARALNREGVPGPRGGQWSASTINGSRKRRNGILNNELYAGRIVWGRQKFIKDPDTGRRQARPLPRDRWQTAPAEHLRIVPAELWDRVQAMRPDRPAQNPAANRRPKHLLSGLIRCGCCGANYIIVRGGDVGCSARLNRGTCGNSREVALSHVQARIMAALRDHLLSPEALEIALGEYRAERRRLLRQRRRTRAADEHRLGEVRRAIAGILAMVENGADGAPLVDRLNALAAEQRRLEADIRDEPTVVELHPNAVAHYRTLVEGILRHGLTPEPEAAQPLRELIGHIVLEPRGPREPVGLTMHGNLAALLNLPRPGNRGAVMMVAGACNSRYSGALPLVIAA